MNRVQATEAATEAYRIVEERWNQRNGQRIYQAKFPGVDIRDSADFYFVRILEEDRVLDVQRNPLLADAEFRHEFMLELNRLHAESDLQNEVTHIGDGVDLDEHLNVIIGGAIELRPEALRAAVDAEGYLHDIQGVAALGGLEVGYSETIGHRPDQEDAFFAGVADGKFSDPSTAPEMLQRELEKFAEERIAESDEAFQAGSTALLTHYSREGNLSIAALGDSRPVAFVKQSDGIIVPVRLAYDHKPDDYLECARIEAGGGSVSGHRVNGLLAVSRSLGDRNVTGSVIADPNTGDPILDADGLVTPVAMQGGVPIELDIDQDTGLPRVLESRVFLLLGRDGRSYYVSVDANGNPIPERDPATGEDRVVDVNGSPVDLVRNEEDAHFVRTEDYEGNPYLVYRTRGGGYVALVNNGSGYPRQPFTDHRGRGIVDPATEIVGQKRLVSSQASLYQYNIAELRERYAPGDARAQVFLMNSCDGLYEGSNERDYVLLLERWFAANPEGEELRKQFEGNVAAYIQSCALALGSVDNITVTFTDITTPPQQDILMGIFDGHGGAEVSQAAALDLSNECLDRKQPHVICAPEGRSIELQDVSLGRYNHILHPGRVAQLANEASPVIGDEKAKVEAERKTIAERKSDLTSAAQVLARMARDNVSPQEIEAKCAEYGLNELSFSGQQILSFYNDLVERGRERGVFDGVARVTGLDSEGEGWYGKHHEPSDEKDGWRKFFAQQFLVETFDDKGLLRDDAFKDRLLTFINPPSDEIAQNEDLDVFGLCAHCKYKKLQEEKPALAALDYPSFLQLLEVVINYEQAKYRKKHGGNAMPEEMIAERILLAYTEVKGSDVELTAYWAKSFRDRGLLRLITDRLRDGLVLPEDLFSEVKQAKKEAASIIGGDLKAALSSKKVAQAEASDKRYKEMVRNGPFKGRDVSDDTATWPRQVDIAELTKPDYNYFTVDELRLLDPNITGGMVEQEKSGLPIFTYRGQLGLHNLSKQVANSTQESRVDGDTPLVSFARVYGIKTGESAEEDLDIRVVATTHGTSMEFTSLSDNAFVDVKVKADECYEEFLIYQRRIENLKMIADIMRAKIALGSAKELPVIATDDQVKQLREKLSKLEDVLKRCEIKDGDVLDVRMEKVASLSEEFSAEDPFNFGKDNSLLKVMNDDQMLRDVYRDKWDEIEARLKAAAPEGTYVQEKDIIAEFRKIYQPAELRIVDAILDAKNPQSTERERVAARHFAAQAATRTVAKEAQRHMDEMQQSMQISPADRAAMFIYAKDCGLNSKEGDKKAIDALLAQPWQQSSCRNGGLLIHRPKTKAGENPNVVLVTFTAPKDREVRPTDKNIAWVYSGKGDLYFQVIRVDDPNKPVRYMKDGVMVSEKLPKDTVIVSEALHELDHATGKYGPAINPKAATFGTSEFTRYYEAKGLSSKQARDEASDLRKVYESFQIRATSVSKDGERQVAIMHGGKSTGMYGGKSPGSLNLGKQTITTRAAPMPGVAGIETTFDFTETDGASKEGDIRYSELLEFKSSSGDPLGRIVMEVKYEGKNPDGTPRFSVDRSKLFCEYGGRSGQQIVLLLSNFTKSDVEELSVAESLLKIFGEKIGEEGAVSIAEKADELAKNARFTVSYHGTDSAEPVFVAVSPSPSCQATEATEVSKLVVARHESGRGGRGNGLLVC
jgi:serine/threonine protein phosphatase PrpC